MFRSDCYAVCKLKYILWIILVLICCWSFHKQNCSQKVSILAKETMNASYINKVWNLALLTYLCLGRPCFSSSDVFCFAFLSISLLASVFPVSLPFLFLFLRLCLIHARMPDWGRAFVHGHTFLHSWSGPMTLVVGLLHGATCLSSLPLVLFVSFIGH